jgi:hypothetical protein
LQRYQVERSRGKTAKLPLKTHNLWEKITICGSQFVQPTIKFALLPVKFNQPSRKNNIQSHQLAHPSLQIALLSVTQIVQCQVTIKKGENILGYSFKF